MNESAEDIVAVERAHAQPGFSGSKPVELHEAARVARRVLDMERLGTRLRKGNVSPADESFLAQTLGPEALASFSAVNRLGRQLLGAGYLEDGAEGLKLSPRAMRRIGQKALSDVFSNLGSGHLGGLPAAPGGAFSGAFSGGLPAGLAGHRQEHLVQAPDETGGIRQAPALTEQSLVEENISPVLAALLIGLGGEAGDENVLGVDLHDRFAAGNVLTRRLQQALQMPAQLVLVRHQAGGRRGQAIGDTNGLDTLAERALEGFQKLIVITRLARLDTIGHTEDAVPAGSVQLVLDGATAILPLAGVIDLAQERDRLGREIDKVDGEIAKAEKKLGNDAFIAKAPPEVVETQKERLEEGRALRTKLTAALSRLAS